MRTDREEKKEVALLRLRCYPAINSYRSRIKMLKDWPSHNLFVAALFLDLH